MIRESEYFIFAGERSDRFGIINVAISDGLYQESFMANRTIKEQKIPGRDKPYYFGVDKDPLSFQVSFYFRESWNDDLIDQVVRWLDVDYYQPLSFSSNFDKVYYAMPSDSSDLIHNGLKQGYITLNIRCDSPYVYSRDMISHWYDCSSSPTTFEIMNIGQYDIYPFIEIQKIGDGDIAITNLSRANSVMQFTSIDNKEILYVNGENHIIETSLPNTVRYSNFNDFYLPFYTGNNVIRVDGTCKVKFQYRYQFSS